MTILNAASRGPDDPDLDLARLIVQLPDEEDSPVYETTLERLIRDAHPDCCDESTGTSSSYLRAAGFSPRHPRRPQRNRQDSRYSRPRDLHRGHALSLRLTGMAELVPRALPTG